MNILIVGVGGQGTLLASKIIGGAAMAKGYDVKVSEVHGMSQRGGSVVTYVKYSDKSVFSPIIGSGEADIILSFELLEAYRNIQYLKKDGMMIVNSQKINPMPVISGAAKYPENIEDDIEKAGIKLFSVDALNEARVIGNEKTVNTVLIGLMAVKTDIAREIWIDTIHATVPKKAVDDNIKAFETGYNRG